MFYDDDDDDDDDDAALVAFSSLTGVRDTASAHLLCT